MKTTGWIHTVAMLAGPLGVSSAAGQSPVQQVYTSDSTGISGAATVSPDGRWLLFAADNAEKGASLWVVSTSGGAPIRLTSDGYGDWVGTWFLSGDRIAFTSTRPSRNGDRSLYLMTLGFDKSTGRAVGVPRQLSIESVKWGGFASADGKWMTYVRNEGGQEQLKLIPSNGGAPRLLASAPGALIAAMHFSRDGKFLYYTQRNETQGTPTWRLQRITLPDGKPETLVTANHVVRILPADNRFVVHTVINNANPGLRFEVRTLAGKLVAEAALPRGMGHPNFTSDGWGVMGVDASWIGSVHIMSLATGEDRVLVSGGKHWPEAWMPDGSALITDRQDGPGIVAEVLPLAGGVAKRIALPAGAVNSGWNTSVGPFFSYRVVPSAALGSAGYELHAVDLRSGQSRALARNALLRPFARGRGGMEGDGEAWVHAERGSSDGPATVVRTDPASGKSETIRTFPANLLPAIVDGFAVHGARIAYLEKRGDSAQVTMTNGLDGKPRRLAVFQARSPIELTGPVWSWSGMRLAVAHNDAEVGSRSQLFVIEPDAGQRQYDLSAYCDSLQWLPDESGILMICYPEGGPSIVKLDLKDGRQVVLKAGRNVGPDGGGPWELLLSPDGRHVAYTLQKDRGASVVRLDLRSLLPK